MTELPVKLKSVKVKKRFFDYLIFQLPHNKTLLHKREHKDIWQHLYEFPLVESQCFTSTDAIVSQANSIATVSHIKLLSPEPVKHKLTHQEINLRFWEIKSSQTITGSIDWQGIGDYPLPIIIHKFLEHYL